MKKFGLIGFPLKHSFSPRYFKEKFKREGILNSEYKAYELESIQAFDKLVKEKSPAGLNVTIPYKKQVINFLDEISLEAQRIGAVNTIVFKDNLRIGYNTDVYGFQNSLSLFLNDERVNNALVLGTGGAAQAVQYVLEEMDICYHNLSRRAGFLNYEDLDEAIIKKHTLIINTTPLGTFPNIEACPNIPYEFLTEDHFLYDLVYNPEVTEFMKRGLKAKAKVKSGLDMLHLQAEKSWEIWNS